MKQPPKGSAAPEIIWHEESSTLTLEGEPVLEYALSWPEVRAAGLGGRWISRYYVRLARAWRLRWQREVYWKACLDLVNRRTAARPFTPWTGKLTGAVALCKDGLLSLRLEGEETRGDGRPCRVRWGDVWKIKEGAPCPPKELFGRRGWKKDALARILEQGGQRQAAGDCFLDPDWERKARRILPTQDLCLTAEGIEFAFPQCAIAHSVEGTPVFVVPQTPEEPEESGRKRRKRLRTQPHWTKK